MRALRPLVLVLALLAAAPAARAVTGWILTTDYSTFGNARRFDGPSPWSVSGDLGAIPGDAAGRSHGGLVYIVGRGTFNLLQVRDEAGFTLLHEWSLGGGLNPQDIAFDAQGEAYVSCYDSAVLLRLDAATGAVLGSYSTAGFADADGLPETGWMVAVGDRLYVTCQRLDRDNWYQPTGPGALLVFDTAAEAWVDMDPHATGVQPLELQGANPYTRVLVDGDDLLVGCAGLFGLADGGVERVDPAAGSLGYVVSEAALGGDVNRIQLDGGAVLAVVNDAAFNTFVARAEGGAVTVLDAGAGFVHADIWLADGALHVLDRTPGAAGLRVLDPADGHERTPGTLATGLPPFLFVTPGRQGVSSAPTATPAAVALTMAPPHPNPFNPATTVTVRGVPGRPVRLQVADVRGRRLRTAQVRLGADGAAAWSFDGRDDRGRALAAGVYLVTARDGVGRATRRVTLVK